MTTTAHPLPPIDLLVPANWSDYELLDTGAGANNWNASAPIASCAPKAARSGGASAGARNG